jgi:hypothetical protein
MRQLFRGFANVVTGLSDLGVSEELVLAIRQQLDPYLSPIANVLESKRPSATEATAVNELPVCDSLFTVHDVAIAIKDATSSDEPGPTPQLDCISAEGQV